MTAIDISAYTVRQPGPDLALAQIIELYQNGYVSWMEAKRLAKKHAGDKADLMTWSRAQPIKRRIIG